jgi:hypothetical protein
MYVLDWWHIPPFGIGGLARLERRCKACDHKKGGRCSRLGDRLLEARYVCFSDLANELARMARRELNPHENRQKRRNQAADQRISATSINVLSERHVSLVQSSFISSFSYPVS